MLDTGSIVARAKGDISAFIAVAAERAGAAARAGSEDPAVRIY